MPRISGAFWNEKRLREERGGGTIVVVGIVEPVRVELHLAVVEVEDRRLVELAVRIRIIALARLGHRISRVTSRWKRNYILPILNLIRQQPDVNRASALGMSKQ